MMSELPFEVNAPSPSISCGFTDPFIKLEDSSLFHEASLLNGEWVQSKSGKTFDVEGKSAPGGLR